MNEPQLCWEWHSYQSGRNSGRLGDTHESTKWFEPLSAGSVSKFNAHISWVFFYGMRFHIEMINGLSFAVFLFKKCSAIYQIRLFFFSRIPLKTKITFAPYSNYSSAYLQTRDFLFTTNDMQRVVRCLVLLCLMKPVCVDSCHIFTHILYDCFPKTAHNWPNTDHTHNQAGIWFGWCVWHTVNSK